MQTLHRSRERLVAEGTALINQLRAILLERGLVACQGSVFQSKMIFIGPPLIIAVQSVGEPDHHGQHVVQRQHIGA